MKIEIGQKWRHKKRGAVYEIVDANAAIQCSSTQESWLEDESWIAYRSVLDHKLCFRIDREFLDGRFELVEGAQ